MAARRIGKRYGGPWYSNHRDLVIFEQSAKEHFPSLKYENRRSGRGLWREYRLTIDVPEYESRNVVIKMKSGRGSAPKVTADGPTSSPHRYHEDDGELCMWYPWDPKDMRWYFEDGLLHLLVLIQAHLFREAWWRENDEWLGSEVPHEQDIELSD